MVNDAYPAESLSLFTHRQYYSKIIPYIFFSD